MTSRFSPFSPASRLMKRKSLEQRKFEAQVAEDFAGSDSDISDVAADVATNTADIATNSAAIAENTADIATLEDLAADLPDYTVHGSIVLFPDALVPTAEGWFAADGTNGTVDMTAFDTPADCTWMQQVGPYPG